MGMEKHPENPRNGEFWGFMGIGDLPASGALLPALLEHLFSEVVQ